MKNLKIIIFLIILIITNLTLAENNQLKNNFIKIIINFLAQVYNINTQNVSSSLTIPESQQLSPQTSQLPLPELFFNPEESPNQPLPTTTNIINFDNSIQSRPIWANAYHSNQRFLDITCSLFRFQGDQRLYLHPLDVIANHITDLMMDYSSSTIKPQIKDYIQKIIDESGVNSLVQIIENQKPKFFSQENGFSYLFQITGIKPKNPGRSYEILATAIFNIFEKLEASPEISFISQNFNNYGQEQLYGSYWAESELDLGYFVIIEDKRVKKIYNSRYNQLSYKGSADLPFKFKLVGEEDLSKDASQLLRSEGIKIITSTWIAKNSGEINGRIKGKWGWENDQVRNYEIEKFDFCPDGCSIELEEKLLINAKKYIIPNDRREGEIYIEQNHKETYTGSGQVNEKGCLIWTRLEILKEDLRKWSRKIDYVLPNNQRYVWSNYSGSISSSAKINPLSNNYFASSSINKELYFEEVFPYSTGPTSSNMLIINKSASISKKEININDQITRTGKGSVKIGKSINISGVYDSLNDLMKITNPENMKDQRIDPISYLNPGERVLGITELFDRGGFYVPGFFTATYGNLTSTVISSKPVKGLPKTVVVLRSHKYYDDAFDPSHPATIKVNNFLIWLRNRGVKVIELRTDSREKMLNAFKSIPNNSWVINIGHGLSTGLYAGREFVFYSEIKKIIDKKNIRIDLFTGFTCYVGRASLSSKVIGAIGTAIVHHDPSMLKNLIGFGTNPWHMTTDDLLSLICSQ